MSRSWEQRLKHGHQANSVSSGTETRPRSSAKVTIIHRWPFPHRSNCSPKLLNMIWPPKKIPSIIHRPSARNICRPCIVAGPQHEGGEHTGISRLGQTGHEFRDRASEGRKCFFAQCSQALGVFARIVRDSQDRWDRSWCPFVGHWFLKNLIMWRSPEGDQVHVYDSPNCSGPPGDKH